VALEAADFASLQALAGRRQRSISWLAAHAIRFFLSEASKGSQAMLDFEQGDRY
jgi:hypothetical protein